MLCTSLHSNLHKFHNLDSMVNKYLDLGQSNIAKDNAEYINFNINMFNLNIVCSHLKFRQNMKDNLGHMKRIHN
jgi:hypothetical protein